MILVAGTLFRYLFQNMEIQFQGLLQFNVRYNASIYKANEKYKDITQWLIVDNVIRQYTVCQK